MNTKRLGPLGLCIASALGACRTAQAPSSDIAAATSAVDAAAAPSGCPAGRKLVWHGELSNADWLRAWDPEAKIAHGSVNAEVIADPRFGHALRVRYPAGSSSSSYAKKGHPEGGLEFMAKLPGQGLERALFSYWLKFDDHFDWVRGGKLPGVCGGSCPSGGADVTGVGGWSMRYMWRPGGDGEQYAYVVPPRAYGTELGLGAWTFKKGGWHRITEELVLNTSGSANGVSRVWYDADPGGPPTFEEKNMTFRLDATPVTTLFFSTFFGGHDASWATPVDTFVDFADLVVCE